MISAQIIKTSIDELKAITKTDLAVYDPTGNSVASTFDQSELTSELVRGFADSPADSQVISAHHLLKVNDDNELIYVLDAYGVSDDAYMIGRVAVCQIQNLSIAYHEKFDRNNFFQNLILDNMLLVDIYNRAKKLHINFTSKRAVFIVETGDSGNSAAQDFLNGMFSVQNGDYITAVDETSVILIQQVSEKTENKDLFKTAETIVDMMSMEAMMNVRVSFGTIVDELKDVSKAYKEAKMAMDVGKIFYSEQKVSAYDKLGIGRLIYQLPVNLCRIFIQEVFGDNVPLDLDDETLVTINKFFENNLNVSETSRQLFIHRNTLVYRIEKLQKATGLDIRVFDDALTFKIALMVVNYTKYLDTLDY